MLLMTLYFLISCYDYEINIFHANLQYEDRLPLLLCVWWVGDSVCVLFVCGCGHVWMGGCGYNVLLGGVVDGSECRTLLLTANHGPRGW